MANVSVIYHAGFGQVALQAAAVARGALSVPETVVTLIKIEDMDRNWRSLRHAHAIVFGAPTCSSGASMCFRSFMDASSHVRAVQGWKGKLAAGFTHVASHSADPSVTLEQLAIFAAQHEMVWTSLGPPPVDSLRVSHFDLAARELRTAELLGQHIAKAAMQHCNSKPVTSSAPAVTDR